MRTGDAQELRGRSGPLHSSSGSRADRLTTGIRKAKAEWLHQAHHRRTARPGFAAAVPLSGAAGERVRCSTAAARLRPKGIAKGMWQFIPETAVKYGLHLGPLVDLRRPDPADDRHHFDKETKAAVSYIKDLYDTDAQASGFLVMACYNWGEGRVLPLVRSMPDNPRERNFWRLLTKYKRPNTRRDVRLCLLHCLCRRHRRRPSLPSASISITRWPTSKPARFWALNPLTSNPRASEVPPL
jgi:hypothetical protein